MIAAPVTLSVPAPVPARFAACLTGGSAADGRQRIDALLSEAKAWPLRALEPGDDLLPAAMPDTFKPQLVVVDVVLGGDGRVTDCRVATRSTFDVLNAASCALVRRQWVRPTPVHAGRQKIAIDWTSRSRDPARQPCQARNGTVPIASSMWATTADFKGVRIRDGAAVLALDVGDKGDADRCTVLAATVPEDLQRALCRTVVQRATILPAVDAGGAPVATRMTITVGFGAR